MGSTPCYLRVRSSRDGKLIGLSERDLEPHLQWAYPNGVGCPGECLQGRTAPLAIGL